MVCGAMTTGTDGTSTIRTLDTYGQFCINNDGCRFAKSAAIADRTIDKRDQVTVSANNEIQLDAHLPKECFELLLRHWK